MKLSWKWLNQIIDLRQIPLNDIINKLTLAGFEIEAIHNQPEIQDKTLNISITANRADASSIVGLARELSILFNIPLSNYRYNNTNYKTKTIKPDNHSTLITNGLSDIKFNIITNLTKQSSPEWLKNYLQGCDIIPINILSDIKEYINLKWGQNLEIFDLEKITNQDIDINLINIDYINNHTEYNHIISPHKISKNIYLETLTYKNKIISIFGLKSNTNIQCDTNTSTIIIMGHICKPDYIKQITHSIKQKTETYQKHLKNICRTDFIYAYSEAIDIILNLTKGHLSKKIFYEWHAYPIPEKQIIVNRKTINYILGPLNINKKHLSIHNIIQTLEKLKFKPQYKMNNFYVNIPEYRHKDIERPIDIIEEIGRIYGFESFFDNIPQNNQLGHISKTNLLIEKIRKIFRHLGLHEVINYSLEDSYNKNSKISLYNPLLNDQIELRNNLIQNLIKTQKYNIKQKNLYFECFEIGRIFNKYLSISNTTQHIEDISIAGIMGNKEFSKTQWSEKAQELSWYQAKGLIENLFEELHANIGWKKLKNLKLKNNINNWTLICHPYRYATLYNKENKEEIGIFSELNNQYSKELGQTYTNYIFEINIGSLIKTIQPKKHLNYIWKIYSNYPSVTRDISLILHKDEEVANIKQYIFNNSYTLIESIEIFNEYNIKNNVNEYRNIGFRITYRSNEKTLNDKDIKNIDNNLKHLLKILQQDKRKSLIE